MADTATLTLTDFLLARIAEDEASVVKLIRSGDHSWWTAERIDAECDAKRALLSDISAEKHEVVDDCWYTCGAATEDRDGGETCNDSTRGGGCDCGRDSRAERQLRILAAVYADHPDCRDEWKV